MDNIHKGQDVQKKSFKRALIILISFFISFFSGYNLTKIYRLSFISTDVLGYSTEELIVYPTNTPTPTLTPSPTPTSTPTPIPTITPTPIPQPKYSSSEVHSFIERFSGQYGVDPNVIRHVAVCESGFNPSAKNGPYAGLFQFSSMTWIVNRKLMGEDPDENLRYDAEEASQTAAYLISIGKYYLWPNCIP